MRKITICAAAGVLALCGTGPSPAHATESGTDGPVHVTVTGTKLRVKKVQASLDGWEPGARASLGLWRGIRHLESVRTWTYSSSKQIGDYRYETVTWNQKPSVP
jgi:hypothetical protein